MERRHSPSVITALLALLAAPLASAVVVLAQPVTQRGPTPVDATAATRPAAISHVVLITLNDQADAQALIADCDRLIATIPTVVSYACGEPLETERTTVDGSYHVGMCVGFESDEGYRQYVEHEAHVALVQAWKPKTASMRIFDISDPTP